MKNLEKILGNRTVFISSEVVAITGLHPRRLQRMIKEKIITPSVRVASGSGQSHIFSLENLIELIFYKHLVDIGLRRKKAMDYAKLIVDQ